MCSNLAGLRSNSLPVRYFKWSGEVRAMKNVNGSIFAWKAHIMKKAKKKTDFFLSNSVRTRNFYPSLWNQVWMRIAKRHVYRLEPLHVAPLYECNEFVEPRYREWTVFFLDDNSNIVTLQTWGQLLCKSNLLHTITLEIVQLNYNYMTFEQSN